MSRKTISKTDRQKVYEMYNGHCAYCGKEIAYKDMQVDHMIPYRNCTLEMENNVENYMPACRRCNHYKRANSLEGFRRMIEKIPEKLERDSYIYRVGVDYGLVLSTPKKIKFYFEEVESGNEGIYGSDGLD